MLKMLKFHFSTPEHSGTGTQSVRAAFPRRAWEREKKILHSVQNDKFFRAFHIFRAFRGLFFAV